MRRVATLLVLLLVPTTPALAADSFDCATERFYVADVVQTTHTRCEFSYMQGDDAVEGESRERSARVAVPGPVTPSVRHGEGEGVYTHPDGRTKTRDLHYVQVNVDSWFGYADVALWNDGYRGEDSPCEEQTRVVLSLNAYTLRGVHAHQDTLTLFDRGDRRDVHCLGALPMLP